MFLQCYLNKIVGWAFLFFSLVMASSCMDDEQMPFAAQLPYTDASFPVAPGDTVLVKGNGFDGGETVRVEGNVMDEGEMGMVERKWNATIVEVNKTELRFVVPEEAEDYCYVYLTHAGYEMELGTLVLGVATAGGDGETGVIPDEYRGRVVTRLTTERGEYAFMYDADRLQMVHFSSPEGSQAFHFEYLSPQELVVVASERPSDRLHCRLGAGGLLEEILLESRNGEFMPLVQCMRKENRVDIEDRERNLLYAWFREADYNRIEVLDLYDGGRLMRQVSVRKEGSGVANNVSVDLNAPITFVFESELLNVMNLCGWLMPREERLVAGHNYVAGDTEEEQNATFSAADYVYTMDYRSRPDAMDSYDAGSAQFRNVFMRVVYTD